MKKSWTKHKPTRMKHLCNRFMITHWSISIATDFIPLMRNYTFSKVHNFVRTTIACRVTKAKSAVPSVLCSLIASKKKRFPFFLFIKASEEEGKNQPPAPEIHQRVLHHITTTKGTKTHVRSANIITSLDAFAAGNAQTRLKWCKKTPFQDTC